MTYSTITLNNSSAVGQKHNFGRFCSFGRKFSLLKHKTSLFCAFKIIFVEI